jgi:hypothetical protein
MTNNHIIVLSAVSKYNLGMRKYKISIFFNKCLILFINLYFLYLLGNKFSK